MGPKFNGSKEMSPGIWFGFNAANVSPDEKVSEGVSHPLTILNPSIANIKPITFAVHALISRSACWKWYIAGPLWWNDRQWMDIFHP